jgi:two-component system OmpR family response regulator
MSYAGATVLLVDDDPMVLEVLSEVAAGTGAKVVACRHGADCRRAMRRLGGRTVLLADVELPDCSGRQLANEFRRDRVNAPVVFATGLAEAFDVVGPLHSNETLLLKPFGVHTLAAALRMALASLPASDEDAAPRLH